MAGIVWGRGRGELETLLASCVEIAIWDRATRLGGYCPKNRGDNLTLAAHGREPARIDDVSSGSPVTGPSGGDGTAARRASR